MRLEKSCGAIIYQYDKEELQILIIQQNPGGHWTFPKGHMENNESEIQTAKREVFEEVGLEIEIDPLFREVLQYKVSKDINKDVVYFAATTKEKKLSLQKEEIMNASWLSLDEAYKKITFASDKKLVVLFEKYINKK